MMAAICARVAVPFGLSAPSMPCRMPLETHQRMAASAQEGTLEASEKLRLAVPSALSPLYFA